MRPFAVRVEDNPLPQPPSCGPAHAGFIITVAPDGSAAVELLAEGSYDAVLVDLFLNVQPLLSRMTSDFHGNLYMVLRSSFDSLPQIIDRTEHFVTSLGLDDELAYRVLLLTSEAVTNAIEHGNRLDSTKHVYVSLRADGAALEVSVEDEGGGYDYDAVADPRQTDNLMKDGGRGLFFIDEMADEVHREKNGSRLRMVFNVLPS